MADLFDSVDAANESMEDPEKHYFLKETLAAYGTEVEKQLPLFFTFLKESAKAAQDREKHIRSISQAKWFVKLKKGVSDTLKAKCLPLNKKTADLIKEHQGSLEIRKKKVLGCVTAAKNIMEGKKKNKKANAKDIELYLEGRDYIKAWTNFEERCRATIKGALAKEQLAIKVLDDYIRDKNSMKEMGEDAYKLFKQEQKKLADSL